jgi:hypothetical protein
MAGSATFTSVPSRKTTLEPRMLASRTSRFELARFAADRPGAVRLAPVIRLSRA